MRTVIIGLALAGMLVAACGGPAPAPTVPPAATPTASATAAPTAPRATPAAPTPTRAPTPATTPTPMPTIPPLQDPMRANVEAFGKTLAAIQSEGTVWKANLNTFVNDSATMPFARRQETYNGLALRLTALKGRMTELAVPPVAEARPAHDKFLQLWAKHTEVFSRLQLYAAASYNPDESAQVDAQVKALEAEVALLKTQFTGLIDPLLTKYQLTRAGVGL